MSAKSVDIYNQNPEEAAKVTAKFLGSDHQTVLKMMQGFVFPTGKEQISSEWLGTPKNPGTITKTLVDISQFLVDQKGIPKPITIDKASIAVDTSYLIKAMQ